MTYVTTRGHTSESARERAWLERELRRPPNVKISTLRGSRAGLLRQLAGVTARLEQVAAETGDYRGLYGLLRCVLCKRRHARFVVLGLPQCGYCAYRGGFGR